MADWKTLASAHASKKLISIPSDWILNAAKLREISGDLSATDILENIHDKKVSAEEVTIAFCKRAALAQPLRGYRESKVDSQNNIFGRTLNPHNTSLTAGGSSGGEGALVSFRGSPLGVGNDLAGSVRIPALCCGVYGFKPTANRIPFAGQTHYPFPVSWLSSAMPVVGPLANSLDDLHLFMETVSRCVLWKYDATALNIPWRSLDSRPDRKLTIGVIAEDPDYPLHPPVRPGRSPGLGARIGYQFFGLSASGTKDLSKELGEPLITSVASQMHPFSRGGLPVSPELGIAEQFHALNIARGVYAEAWKQIWLENQLDVVLAPSTVSMAVPHDTYGVPVYTMMWSVLDYPAAVIPFGKVCRNKDPEPEVVTAPFVPDYTPESNDGVPCSLQIVTPTLQDEECLNAASIIQRCLNRGK
ncbi:Amidase [Fusarium sp. Ph1]|nr:Amidase [Fusarium sp. Ph1]